MWTNAGMLLIGTLGRNFNEILSEIHTFSFKKMYLKILFVKWRLLFLCFNVFRESIVQAPNDIYRSNHCCLTDLIHNFRNAPVPYAQCIIQNRNVHIFDLLLAHWRYHSIVPRWHTMVSMMPEVYKYSSGFYGMYFDIFDSGGFLLHFQVNAIGQNESSSSLHGPSVNGDTTSLHHCG